MAIFPTTLTRRNKSIIFTQHEQEKLMLVPQSICKRLSDAEILRKSIEEVDYFSCLYDRYEEKLLRYIHRIARISDSEAEDILQDAFVKIWKNLYAIDPELKVSSWVFRIVHNETVSWLRRQTSYGKDRNVPLKETFDTAAEPNLLLEGEESQRPERRIQFLLEQLPQVSREVLALKFFEEMSYAEISDVLKIPEGTVATRINRAKKAFAELAAKNKISFEF
ncbi:MAG: RNA polymerase sigma factor [Haliscomenobacter sp.]|nr:RNA polymerase sigma factor [Haliscomenobacter sp.]MBK7477164.1 RNA polymerase sigma factor [Haliscomenobacter sp.]